MLSTAMNGHHNDSYQKVAVAYEEKIETKYYSLLVGPAYRFNDYVSLYGLVRFARTKIAHHEHKMRTWLQNHSSEKANTNSIAYGVGLAIHPVQNTSINLGYEKNRTKFNDNLSVNGFNVSVGYRF